MRSKARCKRPLQNKKQGPPTFHVAPGTASSSMARSLMLLAAAAALSVAAGIVTGIDFGHDFMKVSAAEAEQLGGVPGATSTRLLLHRHVYALKQRARTAAAESKVA